MQLTFKNLKQQTFKLEVDDKITVSEIIIKLKPHKPTPTGCSHLRKISVCPGIIWRARFGHKAKGGKFELAYSFLNDDNIAVSYVVSPWSYPSIFRSRSLREKSRRRRDSPSTRWTLKN